MLRISYTNICSFEQLFYRKMSLGTRDDYADRGERTEMSRPNTLL